MGRVRIGTCSGPADAAIVRSVFDAHEIPIVINAEQHANVLGGLGGVFVPLHIYVDEEYAEDAAALLADMRRGDEAASEWTGDEAGEAGEASEASDAASEAGDGASDEAGDGASDAASDEAPVELQVERRRRTAIALLLGCCVTFGTAHMATGAWLRGMAIAGFELLAITYMATGNMDLGTVILFACVATDVIGGIWRARTLTPQPRKAKLPVARVRR